MRSNRACRNGGRLCEHHLSGLLNALVAEQLPGPGSVFLEAARRFLAPVSPGDVTTAEATVTAIRVTFEVDGGADAEMLESLVRQSQARSAVYDVVTHGTKVNVQVVRG
jgi:acyl dehydratase